MAKTLRSLSSHRKLDLVSEELIGILLQGASFEFSELFKVLHNNLRKRPDRPIHGGEAMLRMRAYEKLQILVKKGAVEKIVQPDSKSYRGVTAELIAIKAASDSAGRFCRTHK